MDRFAERNITYDPIGNIQTYTRYAYPTPVMDNARIDSLQYEYYPKSNRLKRIVDHASHPMQGKGAGKFGDLVNQPEGNYTYDALGRLVADKSENYRIVYDAYDKVAEVRTLDTDKRIQTIAYDDGGYRSRVEYYNIDGTVAKISYYVNDASGNALAIYETSGSDPPTLAEYPVYASGRIGTYKKYTEKFVYELTDHLGNVRAVVNRRVVDESCPPAGIWPVLAYLADYYPFGWLMPDRKVLEYRYGFQGQELDSITNWHAFQLRMYDGRVGRWMSVDPYGQFHSPYVAMGNAPVIGIDPDGGYCTTCPDPATTNGSWDDNGVWYHFNTTNGWVAAQEAVITPTWFQNWISNWGKPNTAFGFNLPVDHAAQHRSFNMHHRSEQAYELGERAVAAQREMALMAVTAPLEAASLATRAGIGAARIARGQKQLSTDDIVQQAANEAAAYYQGLVKSGVSPRQAGTLAHARAKGFVNSKDSSLRTEYSQLKGREVSYGYPGSSRADVYDPATGVVYDFKFGGATLNPQQAARYNTNFPGAPIRAVRPQ